MNKYSVMWHRDYSYGTWLIVPAKFQYGWRRTGEQSESYRRRYAKFCWDNLLNNIIHNKYNVIILLIQFSSELFKMGYSCSVYTRGGGGEYTQIAVYPAVKIGYLLCDLKMLPWYGDNNNRCEASLSIKRWKSTIKLVYYY